MRFWEAMREMDNGKTVRSKGWASGLTMSKEHVMVGHFSYYEFDSEWEIVEQPVQRFSFYEIIPMIKENKRFKRPHWPKKMSFGLSRYGAVRVNLNEEAGRDEAGRDLVLDDFEAADWVEVKE